LATTTNVIDGMMGPFAVQPIKGDDVGKPPFLWIHKTLPPPPTAEQLQRAGRTRAQYDSAITATVDAWDGQMRSMSGGAMRVVIEGANIEHIDFSDESLWNTSLTPDARAAKLKTIATTRAYVRAFFDGCVRGDWSAMRTLVGKAGTSSPEITINMFGKMWPG